MTRPIRGGTAASSTISSTWRVTGDRFEYCVIDDERLVRDGGWFAAGDPEDTAFPAGTCPPIG